MKDSLSIFSERLQNLMDEHGMNQIELAKKLYITNSTLSTYIVKRSFPKIETIVKICEVFNVSMDYLFGISDSRKKEKILTSSDIDIINVPILDYYYNINSFNDDKLLLNYLHISKERFSNAKNLFGLKIHTGNMRPRLYENDICLIERTKTVKSADLICVTIGNEPAIIRELTTTTDGWVLNPFVPLNPPTFYSWEDMEKKQLKLIGKVVEAITFFK